METDWQYIYEERTFFLSAQQISLKLDNFLQREQKPFPSREMYVCVKVNRTVLKIITPNRGDVSKDTQQKCFCFKGIKQFFFIWNNFLL
jgi:hypothetical protein